MTLLQMVKSIREDSNGMKSRERILQAINSAARHVYNWILKEQQGFFLKFDSSIQFIPGTNEYVLPTDLQQIVRIREFDPETQKWRIIHSQDILDNSRMQSQFSALVTYDETDSPYKFYGPYVKAADGKYYINIEPDATSARTIEIVYTAAFVEIAAETDPFLMPDDSKDCIQDFALAEVLENSDDDNGPNIRSRANNKLTLYLTLVRSKCIQDTPKQESYL